MLLNVLRGEHATASEWLDVLGSRSATDTGQLEGASLVSFWTSMILTTILVRRRDEWIARIEEHLAPDPDMRRGSELDCLAARAIVAGDATACARALKELDEFGHRRGTDAMAFAVIGFARAAEARGVALTAEWRSVVAAARAFSERARADWFLGELDRIEAAIPQ